MSTVSLLEQNLPEHWQSDGQAAGCSKDGRFGLVADQSEATPRTGHRLGIVKFNWQE